MRDAYIICMVVGFLLLALSVLGEFFESIGGALEAALNIDFDFDIDVDLAFLPLSGVSICAGLITFGGCGLLIHNVWIALACGYGVAMLVQTGIRRLKKVKNEAMDRSELYFCDAKIINTVLPGGLGTVEFDNIKGTATTFVCRSEDRTEQLKQNTEVVLVDFDGEVAIVKKKNDFSEYDDNSQSES